MGANFAKPADGEYEEKPSLEISAGEIFFTQKDPRSPTVDVTRTPLQDANAMNPSKITKNVDLNKECFEKYQNNIPISPEMKKFLSHIDPRSPAVDFQRTPLAVLIKNPEYIAAYRNMETDDKSDNTPVEDVTNNIQELSIVVQEQPPVHVDKTPVYGLLETNLDYVETDLDTVRRKSKLKNKNLRDLSEKDPRSPSTGIERTPIVICENDDLNTPLSNNIEKVEVSSEIKEIFNYNATMQQRFNKEKANGTSESLLIYEDFEGDNPSTPIVKVLKNNGGSRTPLASMINIEQPSSKTKISSNSKPKSKIPIKIKSSCSPRYLAIRNSHTPRKDLTYNKKSRKIAMDAVENTPPQARPAKWENDNSVIL